MTYRLALRLLAVLASALPFYGQTVLNPGANVQGAIDAAASGATIALNPGTYSLSAGLVITKPLTLKSNVAGTRPVLQMPGSVIVGVNVKSSNVTLDTLRIVGPSWGIYAGDPSTAYTSMAFRNLAVNATGSNGNAGHGIFVANVSNAVVDSSTIEAALVTGILLDSGSANSVVTNNNVVSAGVHGIGVVKSDGAIVAGNTITGANQFGIIIMGSKFCRVERNSVPGSKQDGIVITKDDASGLTSQSTYVGRNTVAMTGLATGNPMGTGIWLNSESNGTLVYGNSASGAPENGLTIFNSSYDWFWGNTTTNNGHGGVFIYGPVGLPYSTGPAPANNFVQGNYAYSLPTNAGVNLNQSSGSIVFNNFVRDAPAGYFIQNTTGNQFFLNMVRDTSQGVHTMAGSATTTYFLNRHLTSMANYADAGSSVVFDGGPVFGGNYQLGGKVVTDNYPYNVETLGRQPSVAVTLPAAGTIAAIGSRKTIEWRSTACTQVDLFYKPTGGSQVAIAQNYPDVGVYEWTVPAVTAGSYTVVVDCKTSAGTSLGVNASSGSFTIAASGLELLSPQNNHRVTGGATTKVTWTRSGAAATGGVNVSYRATPGGALTPLVSNITTNDATVTVPTGATSQAQFVIQLASNTQISDSTDGFVNVTSTTPAVVGPSGTVGIGTLQLVQWATHTSSLYVDIEYFDTTANVFRTLVTNLPDFGRFYFLAPDKTMTNAYLRVRFKSSTSTAITTANSGTFNTAVAGTPGSGSNTNPTAPATGTVSPASGTGSTQTFTVTYSDVNGAEDIVTTYFMVNTVISGANSCLVEYNRVTNRFRLRNDADTEYSAFLPAGGGSTSNSHCTFFGAGSGSSISGNTLTVTYAFVFPESNSGTKNTYALAIDTTNLNSGWNQLGTWTIPGITPPPPSTPQVVSLTPSGGTGTSGTFTAVFRHPGGPTQHYLGYTLFLPLPNIIQFIAQGTCLIEYNRISNGMRLIDNAGTGWIGPLIGVPVAPGTAPLSNNTCTVNVSGTTVSLVGTDMTLTIPVTFNPAGITAQIGTFIQEQDVHGQWTDFRQFGSWFVPGGFTKPGPYVTNATPTSGAGTSMTLNVNVGHTGGASTLTEIHIQFGTGIVAPAPCHAVYFPFNNTVALINDAGTALVGPIPAGSGPLNTGRCSLGAGVTRTTAGNNISLSLPFTFSAANFGGTKNVYVDLFDLNGAVSHWVQTGTWTVQ